MILVFSIQASKRYLSVARSMKRYEDELYEDWMDTVASILPGLLKKTVLTKPPTPAATSSSSHSLESRVGSRTGARSAGSRPASRMTYSYLFPPALPTNCEYVVNFSPQLTEIIAETKYMEKLGFKV